ncbi:hypothetical protein SAZ11_33610 [Streptomyces sp. FXJ1.4098]|nr:hypothetical protein [Streptomyces sp. FXJ1.4098]
MRTGRPARSWTGPVRRGERDQLVEYEPDVRHPVVRHPVVRHPVARQPVARQPVARHPVARQPVARQPGRPRVVVVDDGHDHIAVRGQLLGERAGRIRLADAGRVEHHRARAAGVQRGRGVLVYEGPRGPLVPLDLTGRVADVDHQLAERLGPHPGLGPVAVDQGQGDHADGVRAGRRRHAR